MRKLVKICVAQFVMREAQVVGSRPRFKIDFAPPKNLEALAGMEKRGV